MSTALDASGGTTSQASGSGTTAATSTGASGTSSAGNTSAGGDAGTATGDAGGDGAVVVTPGSYAINAPKQCDNQFYVSGCTQGNASTACGGQCVSQNACEGSKPGTPDLGFICPRFLLFGAEMQQAAVDDWGANPPFNYAIVGHDPDNALDTNGNGSTRSCCECYQLVYKVPGSDMEALVNGTGASAVPIPPPLIVQAFNTAAGGGQNFDVFMGAGGFGGNNACDPHFSQTDPSGKYLYTTFPEVGEGGNGGEKAGIIPACKTTNTNLLTTATLSAPACQNQIASDCNTIAATSPTLASETIESCIASNNPSTFYHLNWDVYAKRIECPTHLTEVTGCKLASQGLPQANANVTTAAQAAAGPRFSRATRPPRCRTAASPRARIRTT